MQPNLLGRSYFFIDGSALLQQVENLWKDKKFFKKKLNMQIFSRHLRDVFAQYANLTVRVSFYLKKDDKRLITHLNIPDSRIPSNKDHWEVVECGTKNTIFSPKTINSIKACLSENLQQEFEYMLPKEKGVDMKLACDVLKLVANGKADNVVLCINDSDFIPLVEACKSLGANVYISSLSKKKAPQKMLTDISDAYLALDSYLDDIFDIANTSN